MRDAIVEMLAPARVSSAGKEDPPVLRLGGARIARHVIPLVPPVQCVGPDPTTRRPIVYLDAREVVCKSRDKTSRAANHPHAIQQPGEWVRTHVIEVTSRDCLVAVDARGQYAVAFG